MFVHRITTRAIKLADKMSLIINAFEEYDIDLEENLIRKITAYKNTRRTRRGECFDEIDEEPKPSTGLVDNEELEPAK